MGKYPKRLTKVLPTFLGYDLGFLIQYHFENYNALLRKVKNVSC